MSSSTLKSPHTVIHLMAAASGLAALSWEVLWQVKAALALGVSAWGTAITLAATMGGMSLGSFLMGRIVGDKMPDRPVRIYGALEIVIGAAGLCLGIAFQAVESFDTWVYGVNPGAAPLIHALAIVAALGVPTVAMGATLPVFGLVARQFRTSIAVLYGLNTLGAAAGALIAAFILIPQFGIAHAIWAVSGVNFVIGILAFTLGPSAYASTEENTSASEAPTVNFASAQIIVLVTGFATLMLEVAWFRSLTAAYRSTTAAFAVMLAVVLVALGLAAQVAPILKRLKVSLGVLIGWAGALVLLATPIIERFDFEDVHKKVNNSFSPDQIAKITELVHQSAGVVSINRFVMTLYVIGPPVLLMGIALPWLLDEQRSSGRWGRMYAMNTLAAIAGSLAAAWLFLPTIGFVGTAWFTGALVAGVGVLTAPRSKRPTLAGLGVLALLIAVVFTSGAGRTRAQGIYMVETANSSKLLESYEGPESTVSAIEYDNGARALIVDGFMTAGQFGSTYRFHEHYMAWMGHLPMLLHPDPKNALVICFGTGQTLNAVRQENPQEVDIVDINPRVLKLAHNFPANHDVLSDPRVKPTIMDGRAYMRRTRKTYDVITLEPMPPSFAGVNALYDREFYELARQRLNPKGIIAQWLPFHLVEPFYAASIVRTFMDVFPNAILWIDPPSSTGILVGAKDDVPALGSEWPGFAREATGRDMSEDEVKKAVLLQGDDLRRYAATGAIVDDDNQLLAYGKAVDQMTAFDPKAQHNSFAAIRDLTGKSASYFDHLEQETDKPADKP